MKVFGIYPAEFGFDDTISKRATSKPKMIVQLPPGRSLYEPYPHRRRLSLLPNLVRLSLLNLCHTLQVRLDRLDRIK